MISRRTSSWSNHITSEPSAFSASYSSRRACARVGFVATVSDSDTLVAGLDAVAFSRLSTNSTRFWCPSSSSRSLFAGKVDVGVEGAVSEAGIQESAVAPRCAVPDLRCLDQDDVEIGSALFGLQRTPQTGESHPRRSAAGSCSWPASGASGRRSFALVQPERSVPRVGESLEVATDPFLPGVRSEGRGATPNAAAGHRLWDSTGRPAPR